MSWVILKANDADADGLLNYMSQLSSEPDVNLPLRSGTPEQVRQWIRQHIGQDNALLLVVEAAGEIVGVLHGEGSADLFTRHNVSFGVSLRPDYRGKGIGTQLISDCLAWARSKPYVRRVQLEVFANNEAAIQLYERMGFLTEGWRARSYYIDTYLMSQQIA